MKMKKKRLNFEFGGRIRLKWSVDLEFGFDQIVSW